MGNDNMQESTTLQRVRSAKRMPEATSSLRHGSWSTSVAWIVLLASLLISFLVWYLARGVTMERAHERFLFRVQTIEAALRERLRAYEFLLRGSTALIAASEGVTRDEWRTYVTKLQVDLYYQGIQGIGFSKHILPSEKEAHVRQVREEGFPNYEIQPDGERPEYTSIVFLEPFNWRNQRAFGYDMFSEPTRKEAMMRARDTGSAAISGKVTLVQETDKDVQAGFLMYLPVYRQGAPQETPEQRGEALMGYVYSPFRMDDFMRGILYEKRGYVELQIFDGDAPLREASIYPSGNMEPLLSQFDRPHLAVHQSILEYAGRRWLLVFESSPHFEETIDTNSVNAVLFLGIIISLLLFAGVLSLIRSRNQALTLADMSFDLERANNGLREEIVERKRAEEALQKAHSELQDHAGRLEEANRDLEGFAYTISHDLRAPLRAINGFARMLADDYGHSLEEEARRRLGVIESSAAKMGLLIDDLLAFSRAGRYAMNVTRIDMNKLVADVVATLETSDACVEDDIQVSSLLPAQGDPTLIRQVLMNLLENAVKFSRKVPDPRIEVGSLIREDERIYYVKDNGVGFDMKYYDKLFEVFQRLVTEKEFKGTGVGLAIVRRLVSRHGGRVWAESKVNEGASFYFTLPGEGD